MTLHTIGKWEDVLDGRILVSGLGIGRIRSLIVIILILLPPSDRKSVV